MGLRREAGVKFPRSLLTGLLLLAGCSEPVRNPLVFDPEPPAPAPQATWPSPPQPPAAPLWPVPAYQEPERRHPHFTSRNVAMINIDTWSEADVLNLFGPPDRVAVRTVGQESRTGPWTAKIYTYEMAGYKRNRFTFALDNGCALNDYDIEFVWH